MTDHYSQLTGQVAQQLHDALVRYAITCTHDRDAAEDLVQELYLRLPQLLPRAKPFEAGGNAKVEELLPFLRGCLRKLAINAVRTGMRQRELLRARHWKSSALTPVAAWDAKLVCDEVLSAVQPIDARILRMRYIEDRTDDDIAVSLNISKSALWKRIERARARIRATDPRHNQ